MNRFLGMLAVFGCCAAVGAGCDSAPAPSSPSAVSPSTKYDGTWTGTTAEGLMVSFIVADNAIHAFSIESPAVRGDACVFGPGGFELSASQNFDLAVHGFPTIASDRFSIVSVAPLSGDFDDGSPLSGSVNFTLRGSLDGSMGSGSGDFQFATRTARACAGVAHTTWAIAKLSQ